MGCETCKDKYYTDIIDGLAERTNKRLVGIIVLLIVLLCASVGYIVYRETQFSAEQIEIIQDNEDGYNSYIGNDGDIVYGGCSDGQTDYQD